MRSIDGILDSICLFVCSLMESKLDMVELLDHQEAEMALPRKLEAVAVEICCLVHYAKDSLFLVYSHSLLFLFLPLSMKIMQYCKKYMYNYCQCLPT